MGILRSLNRAKGRWRSTGNKRLFLILFLWSKKFGHFMAFGRGVDTFVFSSIPGSFLFDERVM